MSEPTPEEIRRQTSQRRGSELVRRILASKGIVKVDDEWTNQPVDDREDFEP